jgi:large subunit ribosomal protein L25
MSDKLTFSAQVRSLTGKKVKQLRKQGLLPGNIFAQGQPSASVSVDMKGFNKLYNKAGDTALIYLSLDSEKAARPVLIEEVDTNPMTGETLHVVFKQVNLKEKISAEIPVELVGEFNVNGGVLLTVHDSIEVEALPTDLPEKFEIDVAKLTEIGQAFTFADLQYDSSKIKIMINEEETDSPILLVQEVKEEVEETSTAEGEAEATTEAATPAAGSTDAGADKA